MIDLGLLLGIASPVIGVATSASATAIPGPFWLFTILQWLTFTLHLIAMNILFGGLLLLVLSRRSIFAELMQGTMTRLLPNIMAATITLGVAPLLFVQVLYGRFFYSASIIQGWNWFILIPVLIVVYYLLYLAAMRKSLSDRVRRDLHVIALIGLVYVSYTFTMISDLASKPDLWQAVYIQSPEGFSLNPDIVQTFFRWAHTITGGLAVAGIVIQLFALYHPRFKENRELLRFGGKIFIMGAIKASIFAIIYLLTLSSTALIGFMKSPGRHTLGLGIVLNIAAGYTVIKSYTADKPRLMVKLSTGLVFGGIVTMVMARHYLRLVFLEGHFDPAKLEVATQMGPIVMFLATFIVGLIVLFWMMFKFFKSKDSGTNVG